MVIKKVSLILCSLMIGVAAQGDVINQFLAIMEQKTLQSNAVMTISTNVSQPINYSGSIVLHGTCFSISIFGIKAAYDGKTLYMYSEDTEELTLSTPSQSELTQVNPFLYAKALLPVCTIVEQTTTMGGENGTIITLTPTDKTLGVDYFVLKVNTKLLPLSIEVKEGEKLTKLTLLQPHFIVTPVDFTLDIPSAYKNDLR